MSPRPARRSVPRLEPLEPRDVPATFTVTTTADTGPGSLADAVDQANATTEPDTITFAVTGTLDVVGISIDADVTLAGPGADQLTLSGTTVLQQNLFSLSFGVKVAVSGLTVSNCHFAFVGTAAELSLDRVALRNNGNAGGGVVNMQGGSLSIRDSTFQDNGGIGGISAAGTVRVSGTSVVVTNTVFRSNAASGSGGAIRGSGSAITLNGCTFVGNSETPFGGNSGVQGGGAVHLSGGSLTASNCTFSGNSTASRGGAIHLTTGATASLTSCTISGNSAIDFGGGIALDSAPAPVLQNTIVAGNILSQAGNPNQPDDYTGTLGVGSGFNLIGANPSGPIGNGQNGNLVGSVANPIDPVLAPLADNGGPTPTMAPQPGSPTIDAGSNAAAAGLATDQRGGNFVRVFNGTVDIGAVEVQPPPLPPPPPPPVAGPGAILAGGSANGTAVVFNQSGGVYAAAGPVTVFPGFPGSVRTASADVNGDGTPDYVGGAGPGGAPSVVVIDGKTGSTLASVLGFEESFAGGVFVAAGDLNGDGRAEVVVTPDQGGGPNVVLFSPNPDGSLGPPRAFFALGNPSFRGGARPAVGDVNGDGVPDVAVGAGFQGGPNVEIHDGRAVAAGDFVTLIGSGFFAFDGPDATTLRNGVFLTLGDLNGDGFADLIAGGGPGGGPRVLVLSGQLLSAGDVAGAYAAPVANFFFGSDMDRGGVRVATVNADGDARADLVVGSGEGLPSRVRVYLGKDFTSTAEPTAFQDLDPFGTTLPGGVFVG